MLNDEMSLVRQRAAEAEQKLTDADERLQQKHEQAYVVTKFTASVQFALIT